MHFIPVTHAALSTKIKKKKRKKSRKKNGAANRNKTVLPTKY